MSLTEADPSVGRRALVAVVGDGARLEVQTSGSPYRQDIQLDSDTMDPDCTGSSHAHLVPALLSVNKQHTWKVCIS